MLPGGPLALPAPSATLIILDGWGIGPPGPGNAIALARTPILDELNARYPHTELAASGRAVGLPDGQMGNSEVGHLTLGAGAVVSQDLTRINDAVATGALATNPVLRQAMAGAPRVHLIGLVSAGGVHSSFRHLLALASLAREVGVEDLVLHAFTDGRDTPPHAGAGHLDDVERHMRQSGVGRTGSVVGRYFAMDRDQRWDRVKLAYELLVAGRAQHRAATGGAAVRAAYAREETDEFVTPTLVGDEARIRQGDSVIAFNFRPDRMREITDALAEPEFAEFEREAPPVMRYASMTAYRESWPYPVAFAPQHPDMTLPRALAAQHVTQLHVAETEKYAHVTYFFNGGVERPCVGEQRALVPSVRDVATYDQRPEMSAQGVADAFVEHWRRDRPGFGVVNFANADMVGHTGVFDATIRAVETADRCVGQITDAVHASGGVCVITADHGNAEQMLEPDDSPSTAHSSNPVPVIVTATVARLRARGTLADVAPTVLDLLGLDRPPAMTGRSLLESVQAVAARR